MSRAVGFVAFVIGGVLLFVAATSLLAVEARTPTVDVGGVIMNAYIFVAVVALAALIALGIGIALMRRG